MREPLGLVRRMTLDFEAGRSKVELLNGAVAVEDLPDHGIPGALRPRTCVHWSLPDHWNLSH